MVQSLSVGVIGVGRMGSTIVRSLESREPSGSATISPPLQLYAYDVVAAKREVLDDGRVQAAGSLEELAMRAEILFLAVKPQHMDELVKNLHEFIRPSHTVVSIAAGITTGYFRHTLGQEVQLVRVMPNTPALIGEGVLAYYADPRLSSAKQALIDCLLAPLGDVYLVEESQLDAVTGLSGSGPAYVFSFMLGLIEGGVAEGLPRELATKLAFQTTIGAARLAADSSEDLEELRNNVVSPGGTTAAGLQVLKEGRFENLITRAVRRGSERSRQLRR